MGERKVVNKYYPPDFDPSKIPGRSNNRPKNQIPVRNVLPFTVRCNACDNFMYAGTKFNNRKETVAGDAYLGDVSVFRFYFRCKCCSSEFTVKTDPQNDGYVVESGATVSRGSVEAMREENGDDAEAMDGDRGTKELCLLAELKERKAQHAVLHADTVLEMALRRHSEEEEERLVVDFVRANSMAKRKQRNLQLPFVKADNLSNISKRNLKPMFVSKSKKPKGKGESSGNDANVLQFLCQNYDCSDGEE